MLGKLRQLGWGDYEAKAYIALLRHSPATGYRVAKGSGVPVAKVYEALARLVERGAVRTQQAASSDGVQYVPVAPDEVLSGLRARYSQTLDELSHDLTALMASATDAPESETLHGSAPVLGRANALLSNAQKSVVLALPQGWESALKLSLDGLKSRRVRLERAAPSTENPAAPGLFLLVVDGNDALIGQLGASGDEGSAQAFATRLPFLVRLCADYVRLRRAVALMPEIAARLQRQDDWMDWEEAKQRRLLQSTTRVRPQPLPDAPH